MNGSETPLYFSLHSFLYSMNIYWRNKQNKQNTSLIDLLSKEGQMHWKKKSVTFEKDNICQWSEK